MTNCTPRPTPPSPLEVWGGVECSCVRVGENTVDQLTRNGHDRRLDDLDRFAALGIKTLRFPLIWERHATGGSVNWDWPDRWLGRVRELGIRPIAGLVHHGSGAVPGGLLDPGFAEGLASFARLVAERYPWIDGYTPVNEPATTARFSGLYGVWHPHGSSMSAFARCFMNECSATRAAMKAIRQITPAAQLVQTEDLGKTHSTPKLAYQAEFENERRWLTFDLLCGRLTPDRKVMWAYLRDAGISDSELRSFIANPCPPDVLGMNHYVTSERFLDEHLDRYPARAHGGNSRHAYADVSAVRVRAEGAVGPAVLLQELWERYRRPIAVTEVQLACTREEQVRWLLEVWEAANLVRRGGADIRAVTSWALLGAFDWDSLLVEQRGYYESGAFDLRAPVPRPTLVAKAIQGLIQDGAFQHPALESPGWWRRPIRLTYPAVSAPVTGAGTALPTPSAHSPRGNPRKVLVTGAGGTLGSAFLRLCDTRGIPATGLRRSELEIADPVEVERVIRETKPWAVINCAGFARVDDAEVEQERCARENTLGAANLALTCAQRRVPFATFSSDFVFDGEQSRPHVESDLTNPLGHYGRTQRDAEERVFALFPEALVVRTSCLFSAWDDDNFLATTLKDLDARRPVRAAPGHVVSPTFVPDLVDTTLNLLLDGEHGLWHLANHGYVTWFEWARIVAEEAGYPVEEIIPALPAELGWIAPRPVFAALGSERGRLMPSWENAVERFLAALPSLRARAAA